MSTSARGRGGKFSKPKRGGRPQFVLPLLPLCVWDRVTYIRVSIQVASTSLEIYNRSMQMARSWACGVYVFPLFFLPNRPTSGIHAILFHPPIIHIHHTCPNTSYHTPLPRLCLQNLTS